MPPGPALMFCFLFLLPFSYAFSQQTASLATAETMFSEHCAKCHGTKGEGVNAVITYAGPSLQAEHDAGLAMLAMEAGEGHMPSFARVLSVQQITDLADYVTHTLAVIPLSGGIVSEGGTLFRTHCAPCHRTAVRGGALAFTGVNAPALTGKSPAIIAGAVRFGPGPMPAFSADVINDRQLDSIVEYVKFVQNPPHPGGNPLGWYGPVAEGLVAWIAVFALIALAGWIETGGKG